MSHPEADAQAPPPPPRPIFFGPEGLRAGWSLALFFLPFVLLFLVVHFYVAAHPHPATSRPPQELKPGLTGISEAILFAVVLGWTFILSRIERRQMAQYGLKLRRGVPDSAAGIFWGFTALSVLIALLLATHTIVFEGFALHGLPALRYAAEWAAAFVFVALLEEYVYRGYLQYTLARGVTALTRHFFPANRHAPTIGFWVSAFVFSMFLFAWTHTANGGETKLGIFSVALAGTVFVFSLFRTGTLWWAIGFHAAWDWAQTFFYGTADSGGKPLGHLLNSHPTGNPLLSGGSTGPEGSILLIPVMLLVALVIHLTLPRRE